MIYYLVRFYLRHSFVSSLMDVVGCDSPPASSNSPSSPPSNPYTPSMDISIKSSTQHQNDNEIISRFNPRIQDCLRKWELNCLVPVKGFKVASFKAFKSYIEYVRSIDGFVGGTKIFGKYITNINIKKKTLGGIKYLLDCKLRALEGDIGDDVHNDVDNDAYHTIESPPLPASPASSSSSPSPSRSPSPETKAAIAVTRSSTKQAKTEISSSNPLIRHGLRQWELHCLRRRQGVHVRALTAFHSYVEYVRSIGGFAGGKMIFGKYTAGLKIKKQRMNAARFLMDCELRTDHHKTAHVDDDKDNDDDGSGFVVGGDSKVGISIIYPSYTFFYACNNHIIMLCT